MKLQVPFIQLPLQFDAPVLAAEIAALGEDAWRPHPLGYPGNSALALVSTDGDPGSDAVSGSMAPTPHLQRCPYLMQVMAELGAVWGRSRLMRLSGHSEVTPHADINYYWRERMRVHVPVVTWPEVRFRCGDAEVHMAEGECWIFDTWRMHHVANDGERPRIHLVADTIGGDHFWELLGQGRAPPQSPPGWSARKVAPGGDAAAAIAYERVNAPVVMSPWELREHLGFLLGEAEPGPAVPELQRHAGRFTRTWQALWARFGDAPEARDRYRSALQAFLGEVERPARATMLKNRNTFMAALMGIVGQRAVAGENEPVGMG